MLRFEMKHCRGQNYDGASSMRGHVKGLKSRVLLEEDRALYVWCYAHNTNLAACESFKDCILLKNTVSTCEEVVKSVKWSPKREYILNLMKQEDGVNIIGLISFSKTRWTTKRASLLAILLNYIYLIMLFEKSAAVETVSDMKACLYGLCYQMKTFEFLFGLLLAIETLAVTDLLATQLQAKDLSAQSGKEMGHMAINTLVGLKSEFERFWSQVLAKAQEIKIGELKLPRKKLKPSIFFEKKEGSDSPETAKQRYEKMFIAAFHTA